MPKRAVFMRSPQPRYAARTDRVRKWTAASLAAYLCAALFGTVVATPVTANAATTPVSTFTKTATNLRNNSTANSATGQHATAQPSDTIKWALNYKNSTGADATVSIADPITNGQTYVPGSLQTPPGLTGNVSGSSVTASGTVLSGATASQSPNFSASAVNFTTVGGDGYSVEGFGNSIYTVFHHNATATVVFCATLSNQVCPGWPGFTSYVSPTAGVPLGSGPVSTFSSNYVNGSFIANGRLYWTVEQNGTPDVFGTQCLDLTTLLSCGYTQFGTTTVAGFAMSGDGIAAADGNYYYLDNNGAMQCVTPTGTACGAVDVTGGVAILNGGVMELGTYGRYVYASFDAAPATTSYLTCFDTATHTTCATFPKLVGPRSTGFDSEVMPVVSSTGAFLGACAIFNGACFDPSGNAIANAWSQTTYSFAAPNAPGGGFGTGVLVGTMYYTGDTNQVDCFDFALPLVGGKVQPCAAFATHPPDPASYTVRQLLNLPGCMASNGDGGHISIFNAVTGAPCASASQTLKLDPTVYYCDGQPGHIDSWGAVTLPGLSASDYAGATLTLFGADGTPLPAWTNVPFPTSGPQSIDISAIPVTGNTATLTAQVNLAAVNNTAAVNASRIRATWIGDPIQVCYQTTIDPVPCLTTVPISNTANAVTTAGSVSDAPTGNSSGEATIDVTPSSAQCMLHLAKTAGPDPTKPGATVTYTVTVQNTGTMDYRAADPAQFTDDITDVLADASYNTASLSASAGTASYNPATDVISWSGPLAANATATITYTVTVNDPDLGDHSMFNQVTTPPGTPSNCAANSTDAACDVTVPISDLTASKSANPADGSTVTAGQVVTYTLTFANTGKAPATVDYTDDLSKVLDDATVTSQPNPSNANLTSSAISGGTFTVTGSVPANTTYTVTYQVTVNPDGQRGDDDMLNFVFPTGTTPPTDCAAGDPLCTEHRIPEVVTGKTSNPADGSTLVAGDTVTYTLTFHNGGAATGTLDYVDHMGDVLDDANLTSGPNTSNGNITATVNGNRIDITGTIPTGSTYTVTYTVTILPFAQQGNHEADNFLTPSGTPPPSTCDPADPNAVCHPIRHLSITKSASTNTIPKVGAQVTYTIVVTNDGNTAYDAANPATMADDLSKVLDDATYNNDATATSGSTPAVNGNSLDWSGPLARGDSVTITYSVTYQATGDTLLENTACVPPQGTDPRCATVDVPGPLIDVTKSVNPADGSTVVAGQTLTYTLSFKNTGQGPGTVDYTDDLSNVLDDADVTTNPSTSNADLSVGPIGNGTFEVTGTVPANTTYTVTYQVTVKPDGQRGDDSLDNFVVPTGTAPPATCQAGDATCTHNPVPDIEVSKSVDPTNFSTVHAGDVLTYTLTFHNKGQATGSTDYIDYLADVLDDASLTGAPVASNPDLAISAVTDQQFEVQGTVPAGATYTVTYQVTIKPDGQRGNDVANNFVAPKGTTPPTSCAPRDPLCTSNPMPDVASSKSVDPSDGSTVVAGQVLTYTLSFDNTGQATGSIDYTDDLSKVLDDADLTAVPVASSTDLTIGALTNGTFEVTGTVPANTTYTVTYQVTVKPDGQRGDNSLDNFLVKTGQIPPANCAPNDASCTHNPVPQIEPSKTSDPASGATVTAGQVVTYTLTFANTGKATGNVDYIDYHSDVLDDATLTSGPTASNADLSVNAAVSGQFEVTGTVPAGTTYSVTYQVTIKPDGQRGNDVANNFLVPKGQNPPANCDPASNLCTTHPMPDITPAKSVDPASTTAVQAGDVLTYTLTWANTGTASGSIDYIDYLADVLDDATVASAPVASSPDLTVSAIANGQFEVSGTVPAGSTYTVTYQVTIKPDGQRGNDVANNFAAPKGTTPPTTCDPADPLCTTNPMPDVQYWKTVDPVSGTSVVPGQTLTYTLHFTNHGTAPGDVSKVDDLTQAVDDARVTRQPVASDPALTATPFGGQHRSTITGTLAAGQTVTVTYDLTVRKPDNGDHQVANFLLNPNDPPPTSPKCTPTDSAHPTCSNNPVGELAVTKSVRPQSGTAVKPGRSLTYTLTFTDTGAGPAKVDYVDDVHGALDDATLVSGPGASDPALQANWLTGHQSFRVTGTLAAGQTARVTYTVQVKPYDQQGDHQLDNFLEPHGVAPPAACVAANPLCTHNPVPKPPNGGGTSGTGQGGNPGGTPPAFTGQDWRLYVILAGLLLGSGGLLLVIGRRRLRREPA